MSPLDLSKALILTQKSIKRNHAGRTRLLDYEHVISCSGALIAMRRGGIWKSRPDGISFLTWISVLMCINLAANHHVWLVSLYFRCRASCVCRVWAF